MATISEALAVARQHHQSGRLALAELVCRQILQAEPRQGEARRLLSLVLSDQGVALAQEGHSLEAIANFHEALELDPDHAAAYSNLGNALVMHDRIEEGVACYRRALERNPDYAEAHGNLGNALMLQERHAEAAACYRRALELRPDWIDIYRRLGDALRQQDEFQAAAPCYRRFLEVHPDSADVQQSLGLVLKNQGKLDEAVACCRRAIELQPDFTEAHIVLGNTLKGQGKLHEAIACYRRALEIRPDDANAHGNLGLAFQEQGWLAEAAACYQRALEIQPDHPDTHWNQALLWLLCGDFQRGWAEYEWRWRKKQSPPRPFVQPLWDGQSLEGKTILLHAEQGLGDTLQFIRYAAPIHRQGATVIVECPPRLLPLLGRCAGVDQLVAKGAELPPFDVHAPLMSLPRIMNTRVENVPAEIPYLSADPALVARWREALREWPGFRVGIGWQGNPRYLYDRYRSIPLAHFAPLAEVPGVTLISLQKEAGTEQLAQVAGQFPVIDLGRRLDEGPGALLDTAAVMMGLDLLITSDSAIAHLAGALGVPVWVALPSVPDWRWLLARSDCPWYPTMRLFRQKQAGDWGGTFAEIRAALEQHLGSRRAPTVEPLPIDRGDMIN